MANPENLVILKILVQTDAVRFGVPFCICLLFSYHAPFSPHTVHVCYRCTCARPAHLNTPAFRCPSDLRIATLLTNLNRTGSSADTLDMDNPENLVILKILVQTTVREQGTTITRKLAILTYAIGAFPLFTNNEFNASAST